MNSMLIIILRDLFITVIQRRYWWLLGLLCLVLIQAILVYYFSYIQTVVFRIKDAEWTHKRNISIEGDHFMIHGKPMNIHSGSLHYFRLPSEYWRDRLQKLKAAGLNAVSTYVEWSFHQPEEGSLLFEGDRDVKRFIEIAAEEGLFVLLRPGPYICAERDLGGLPYWLLSKYPNIRLRSTDDDYIRESKLWFGKLFGQIESLLVGNGGPIILVQVENEYGVYGNDKVYMAEVRDMIEEHVGDNALLYTADGTLRPLIYNGAISGALPAVNFKAVNNVMDTLKPLRQFMPTGPLMNAEFYSGWLTYWGGDVKKVSTEDVIKTLRDMLQHNISFNFYMLFGGTNFEFTSGANYFDSFLPVLTSYDYDAPLTEAGDPTPKYYAIRDTMIKHLNLSNTPAPLPSKKGAYGNVTMSPKINLLSAAGRSSLGVKYEDGNGSSVPTFEALRQRGGLVLYEITLSEAGGILKITKPRDRVYVFVGGQFQGIIDRMNQVYSVILKSSKGSVLSLLVENQGRVNYRHNIHDFKGIVGPITYNKKTLSGVWSITGYPLNSSVIAQSEPVPEDNQSLGRLNSGPVLFGSCFVMPTTQEPLDTFLDPTGWGKGYIWVNGHNLGRYWPGVGPQVTLFVPGVWLRAAPRRNCIHLLELEAAPAPPLLHFIDYPILNRTSHQIVIS